MSQRVLLVDDHDIVRLGLRQVLEGIAGIEVVGEARDGREAVSLVRETSPDLVLMDIVMPEMNGVEATRQIMAMAPETRIIIVSMHSDHRYVTETLDAGACGYVLKDHAPGELPLAIRNAIERKTFLSGAIAGAMVSDYLSLLPKNAPNALHSLTGKEREVLQMIAEGKTNKQMAAASHVTSKTIESHRAQIMQKLRIHTVAELTKFAVREGITSLTK